MSESQALLERTEEHVDQTVDFDSLESYRKIMFGDMVTKSMPIHDMVTLYVTNTREDHWWLYAKSKKHHRSWCAQIVGSDDDTSPCIARLLVTKLIMGEIFGEVDPESIEVLKANAEMKSSGESVDLSGLVVQDAIEHIPEDKIPEEFKLQWSDDD